MKTLTTLKNLALTLTVMLVVSCNKSNNPEPPVFSCDPVFDDDGIRFKNYDEMMDTTGLGLYRFAVSDEEALRTPFPERYEIRNIPEDFLRKMTTKALFHQVARDRVVRSLRSGDIFSQNFYNQAVPNINMVSELFNRPDLGPTLLKLMQKYDPSMENDPPFMESEYGSLAYMDEYRLKQPLWEIFHSRNAWVWFLYLYMSRPEAVNSIADEEMCTYIHHLLRCLKYYQSIRGGIYFSDDAACFVVYGLGNVMIRYNYEPFIQEFCSSIGRCRINHETNEVSLVYLRFVSDVCVSRTIYHIEQFINQKK